MLGRKKFRSITFYIDRKKNHANYCLCRVEINLIHENIKLCRVEINPIHQNITLYRAELNPIHQNIKLCRVEPNLIHQNITLCRVELNLIHENIKLYKVEMKKLRQILFILWGFCFAVLHPSPSFRSPKGGRLSLFYSFCFYRQRDVVRVPCFAGEFVFFFSAKGSPPFFLFFKNIPFLFFSVRRSAVPHRGEQGCFCS